MRLLEYAQEREKYQQHAAKMPHEACGSGGGIGTGAAVVLVWFGMSPLILTVLNRNSSTPYYHPH